MNDSWATLGYGDRAAPAPDRWQPLLVHEVQLELGTFHQWVLCGGCSIDWLMNRRTRQHTDLDIGVFRSDLSACLETIDVSRVYLCDPPGSLKRWGGEAVPEHVHDIWITDIARSNWILQLMVYDDENESVVYRRDRRISWPKEQHAIEIRNLKILNPVITLLFKLHRSDLRDKDCLDIISMIDAAVNL